jgi:signal-transduction protein with cAMP-binding, CBS, and nucleotidyltransferase domain
VEKLCATHPYQQFPLVIDGRLVGMLDRKSLLSGHAPEEVMQQAETVSASATIGEAVLRMVDKSVSLLVVLSPADESPIGIVTLHNVVRLQSHMADSM